MSKTVSELLSIKHGIWVTYQDKDLIVHTVPFNCFGDTDLERIDWERDNPEIQRGWCFDWCDDSKWSDVFTTKQGAFDNAYADFNDGLNDGGITDLEWLTFAKNNELDDKVVVTTMNGYDLSEEVRNKLANGDY